VSITDWHCGQTMLATSATVLSFGGFGSISDSCRFRRGLELNRMTLSSHDVAGW
jgi:hypothetical protein